MFELDADGGYQQVSKTVGGEPFDTQRPFPMRVVPVELLGRLAEH